MTTTQGRRGVGGVLLAVVALLAAPSPAIGAPDPAQDGAEEAGRRIASAKKAAVAGDAAAARHHLISALAVASASGDAVGELLRLDDADPEARRLWVLHGTLAGADAQGRFTAPKSWPKVPPEDSAAAQEVAKLRAAASAAVTGAASKLTGSAHGPTLRFLEDLACVLEDGVPAAGAGRDATLAVARAKVAPDRKKVVGALLRLAQASVSKEPGTALAAARLVRGLVAQEPAGKALPAAPSDAARVALEVIDKVRDAMRKEEQAPPAADPADPAAPTAKPARRVWTVEELGAVPEEEFDAWNRDHADWSNPGVATSPTGLYRVETVCGLRTLLTVAEKAETQHKRIAAWNGGDPFGAKQGTIRVCPDDPDFEAEGRPFWWAGGFQSGDTTTMIARFPDVRGIVGTLVHELTHRFDVRSWPGLPPWVLEGRATYVATCAYQIESETMDEQFVLWGRLWETQNKGYGRRREFESLLGGSITDYRDNYDAGYALWLFLTRFRGFDTDQRGRPAYAAQIPAYLKSHVRDAKADPVKRFQASFTDGRDGRAADLDAFLAQFDRFISEGGSGARPPASWKATWEVIEGAAWEEISRSGMSYDRMYDRPTWAAGRSRSDPPEPGEGLAREAAELLLAAGQKAAAVEAMRWALSVDDADPAEFVRGAEIEAACGDAGAGWSAKAIAHRMNPVACPAPDGPPPSAVASALRSASALADAYGAQSEKALAAGRRRVATALRAERDRIAEVLAVPTLGEIPPPDAEPSAGSDSGLDSDPAAAPRAPVREPELLPARSALEGGLVEERWAPLDSQPGMPWHLAAADILELGRKETAADVSGALRDALTRKIAVRTRGWYAGSYTVRTRVRFVSAFVDALLVVGRTGKDRGVEIRLSGGDWEYATGAKKGNLELSAVRYRVNDLHPWSEQVGSVRGDATFASPRAIFDVEVRVAGPYVQLWIDGVPRASFRTPTGAPVEGNVVFGLERGIVRFEEPTVRRNRVLGPARAAPDERFDEPLRLDRAPAFTWATATGRRVEGVPADPRGTLLLWFPEDAPDDAWEKDAVVRDVDAVRAALLGPWSTFPRTVVAVPAAALAGAGSWMQSAPGDTGCDAVVAHAGQADIARVIAAQERGETEDSWTRPYPFRPVWIAIDAGGVIRSCGPSGWPWNAMALFRSLAGH